MQAGLLRDKIDFMINTPVKDLMGGVSDGWEIATTKRTRVAFAGGNRKQVNGEVFNDMTITCTIRYCRDINESMRLVYEGRNYNIKSINRDRLQQTTVIQAELINE